MRKVVIHTQPGFDEWREHARGFLKSRIAPDQIIWTIPEQTQTNLFTDDIVETSPLPDEHGLVEIRVSKAFMEMAETVLCHNDPERFGLMYKILWRLNFENRSLMSLKTDDDILRAHKMEKAVRRDAYKIKAYVRFRKLTYQDQDIYVAWHEPEHFTLERVTDFFKTRFKNMKWSILTPYRGAHWNGRALMMEDNPNPDLFPKDDQVEKYWLTYYQNIFNPARLKTSAMLNQMPKKYWKTMPETVLIKEMIETADKKTREMIEKSKDTLG